jgi:chromosome partitioning protein
MLSLPLTVAVLSEKGGVGKTTLALHLAYMFAKQCELQNVGYTEPEYEIALIDADPQASIVSWYEERGKETLFKVVEYPKPYIHTEIDNLVSSRSLYRVIDCPPRITDIARSAVLASDYVLIPVQPSSLDVWACQDTIALIGEAVEKFNLKLHYGIALNRVIVNTEISRKVGTALRKAGITVLDTWIKQRVAFAECVSAGKTIFETEPQSKGAYEMRQLFKDLIYQIDYGELSHERP